MKIHRFNATVISDLFFVFKTIIYAYLLVNVSEPLPSLDMYQSSKRGLQVLLWTDMLKGFMIALGWLLREPTTINYPFEKGPLSPVRQSIVSS